ncbi:CPBP family intramembrane glutamic endopeptidase [Oceanobacillus sp. 1P07AA]|uniref:CPBP family intramembrane glutamic endopeptidase n=1 Tax=Oceanobacillus sp. 1P07AA TaxID=3132293 RepID=UPI0039A5ECDE
MKQDEIIKQLSDKELKYQLVFSQLLLLAISLVLSLILFPSWKEWLNYIDLNINEILLIGCGSALIVIVFDVVLMSVFPKESFDDGGINKRIFENQSILFIIGFTLLVAICEELLFRGTIQITFGYVFASLLFALVHIRYLKKPVLFVSVVLVSFFIGWIFERTENLLITITTHFVIDVVLGFIIRFKK